MLISNHFTVLQYQAKPYLDFQNLGCHCKVSRCHFDTQKRLKKTLSMISWGHLTWLKIYTKIN